MNAKEFAQHKFDILAFMAMNVLLMCLITLFSVFGWAPTVRDEFVKWEYGAFTGLCVCLQQSRNNRRAADGNGNGNGNGLNHKKEERE